MGPLCPISIYGSPVALLKFQIAPRLILLMSSGSRNKKPRYACLSEAKASHSQRMWAEVSSSAPHLLHSGLSDSPVTLRCILRVLCPVSRPVTALDCVGTEPALGVSGPTNFRTEPSLVSSSALSLPCTPACPGTPTWHLIPE